MSYSPFFQLIICCLLFCSSNTKAQDTIAPILMQDAAGQYFYLNDSIQNDQNYILNHYESWCGWCKKELRWWRDCYQEWEQDYNTKVVVICSDGYDEQAEALSYFNNFSFPYTLWFTEKDSIQQYYRLSAYPTNRLVDKDQQIVSTIRGAEECHEMKDSLAKYFPFTDEDQDGFGPYYDCNDQDDRISPDAVEIRNNGIDENCDGLDDFPMGNGSQLVDDQPSYTILNSVVSVFANEKTKISIFSIDSQQLIYSAKNNIYLDQLPLGVYILLLEGADKIQLHKIWISN